jgi:hypothetical protein
VYKLDILYAKPNSQKPSHPTEAKQTVNAGTFAA